jgi:hypothetical protein
MLGKNAPLPVRPVFGFNTDNNKVLSKKKEEEKKKIFFQRIQ